MKQLILTTLTFLIYSHIAFANGWEIGGICYIFNTAANTASVTYRGTSSSGSYSGSVTIPETVTFEETEYHVVAIGERAFYNCDNLQSVVLPNSITSIGSYAFAYSDNLSTINLPNSVISIGIGAFSGCKGISSPLFNDKIFAKMPINYVGEYSVNDGITTINDSAFEGCTQLNSVTLPNSVTDIGILAFSGCSSLSAIFWVSRFFQCICLN